GWLSADTQLAPRVFLIKEYSISIGLSMYFSTFHLSHAASDRCPSMKEKQPSATPSATGGGGFPINFH
ncbi:hypothetical protein AAV833_12885, partial [Geobacillus stearothermophilus]|uniref:hypothetical protein n=1 Tax=Geobacillus stearothermophilus TaxID=1422 RepID=UPI003D23F48C